MIDDRERAVTQAFVSVANSLVDGFDIVDLLSRLAEDCVRLLDVTSAGILLADGRDVLHVVAASSEATRNLQLFQLQSEQGPCLECYRTGTAVSVADLAAERQRWPQFVRAAGALGIGSVCALPMRLRDRVLGTLGLFNNTAATLDDDDLNLAQALAHVASIAIIQEQALVDREVVAAQLQTALNSRVVLEQAKGLLAQQGDLDMDEAFAQLRSYARDHNLGLTDLARSVAERQLPAELVLEHAMSRAARKPLRPRAT